MRLFESKRDYGLLALFLIVPNLVGVISSFLSGTGNGYFQALAKPPLTPPSIVFPVAWTVLYTLMGLSFFIAYKAGVSNRGVLFFGIQLLLNGAWSIVFFGFRTPSAAFVVLVFLLFSLLIVYKEFRNANRRASIILLPYIFWVVFAAYLNLGIVLLN